jgi:hypothetical protein
MRSSSGSSLFISLSILLILNTIKIFKKYYQSIVVMWQRMFSMPVWRREPDWFIPAHVSTVHELVWIKMNQNARWNNEICWDTCHCQRYNIKCCATMILRKIYVAGNNETCFGVHPKCPIFLPNFKQIWNFSTDFHEDLENQSSRKSVQWERCC